MIGFRRNTPRIALWTLLAAAILGFFWRQHHVTRIRQEQLAKALKEPWLADPKFLLPLLGGTERTDEEKRADARFIETASQGSGSRELASVQLVHMAWEAYQKQDYKLAMSRFNQAWLVDPNQGEVYWGFGLLNGVEEKIDQTIGLLKKAVELVPQGPKKAQLYCDLAYALSIRGDPVEPASEREKIYAQAAESYKQAEALDPNMAVAQAQWAMLLFKQGKFKESWERAGRAKKLGGQGLDPEFVKVLEAQVKKPLPKT